MSRKVWEFMTKEPPAVVPSDSVAKALNLLKEVSDSAPGVQSLIVTDPATGSLKGVVTLRRIVEGLRKAMGLPPGQDDQDFWERPELSSRLRQEAERVKVKEVMAKRIYQVKPYDTIGKAMDLMLEKKVRGIPVVENQKVIGVIRMRDIFAQLHQRVAGG
ncbi:MAG: CBS domain-containing protein [Deltaproteobacteria bacterium]|nr:CBS domain-containing protein [Deltaproteobacteria bacterium]